MMSAALKTPAEIYEAWSLRSSNDLDVFDCHCLQAMPPFFDKRLDTAAIMLEMAKRNGMRMHITSRYCISHTCDFDRARLPIWWYSSDTHGLGLLPWCRAPTAWSCWTLFLHIIMYVLLGMLQEERVDLVIGDSSLCAVMPEVFWSVVNVKILAAMR